MTDIKYGNQQILKGVHILARGTTKVAASTVDLSTADGNNFDISGNTTITGFGTVAAGIVFHIRFTGIPLLTYNATSLILPTEANIQVVAGDRMTIESLGSGNWLVHQYTRKDGTSTLAVPTATTSIPGVIEIATDAEINTGTDNTRCPTAVHLHATGGKFARTNNAASNTQTIAHGLGRIPRKVRIEAGFINSANGAINCFSVGTLLNSAVNAYYVANANGTGTTAASTTNIVSIITTGMSHVCTISVDATNITLTWTSSGSSGTNDIQVLWEVI